MPPIESKLESGTQVIDVADIVKQIVLNGAYSGKN